MKKDPSFEEEIDRFAEAMKARMRAKKRQGWRGWEFTDAHAARARILDNAARGTVKNERRSLVDCAALCMMAWRHGK